MSTALTPEEILALKKGLSELMNTAFKRPMAFVTVLVAEGAIGKQSTFYLVSNLADHDLIPPLLIEGIHACALLENAADEAPPKEMFN